MYNKSNLIVGFIFVHTFHGAVVEKLQRGYDFGKTLTLIRRVSGNLRNISDCERVELIRCPHLIKMLLLMRAVRVAFDLSPVIRYHVFFFLLLMANKNISL